MEQDRKPRNKPMHFEYHAYLIFDKGGKNVQWHKDINTDQWNKIESPVKKKNKTKKLCTYG